jgi:uncharacterized membrane protein YjfL (UPF0719 family)
MDRMEFARQMLTAGGVNLIYMLVRAISFVLLFWVVYRIFDAMTPGINIPEQINQKNTPLGIIIAALALGLAYIIGQM